MSKAITVNENKLNMGKNRLEAFSDGVIAIIITIMVLEITVPHTDAWVELEPLLTMLFCYILSFIYVGIYWNNHHHMLHATTRVTGSILWANLHLLFWLSLLPFATNWMREHHFSTLPLALYGVVLFMAGIAFLILQKYIINNQGKDSVLAKAVGRDLKGKVSALSYLVAIMATLYQPVLAEVIYVFVALMWLVPDKRIERILLNESKEV